MSPRSKGSSNPPGLRDIPFALPAVTRAQRARARRLAAALDEHYPHAHCELAFSTPHELLIATILSAQSTDAGVNRATPALFAAFPAPADYAAAAPGDIEPYIRTIGLFRNKARSVHASMTSVVNDFGGRVPDTMDGLLTLRGVARKTANVVLGNAYGINDGLAVDTHVQRLAWRLGLVEAEGMNPVHIEKRLMALFPRDRWTRTGHQIIFHGRTACTARPNRTHDHPICARFGVNCPGKG